MEVVKYPIYFTTSVIGKSWKYNLFGIFSSCISQTWWGKYVFLLWGSVFCNIKLKHSDETMEDDGSVILASKLSIN